MLIKIKRKMEGDSRVASAGTSHQTRTAMAGLERTQVPHSRLEKGSRIPIKSKMPQHAHQKKLTSQTQAQTCQNAITSPEKSQGRFKSGAACLEKEKAPNRLTTRVRPTASGRRDGDDSTRGKAATNNAESTKENVAPSSSTIATTSVNGGGQQLEHPVTNGIKKPSMKSSMSYMELKRRHQELLSEIATLEGKSKEQEESHWEQVNHFAKEIEESKETNLALREEIHSYQAVVNERNTQLDALQQRLEEIKFENERLAAILEDSKLDAVTGEQIAKSTEVQALQSKWQLQVDSQEQALDDFITALECTLLQLQGGRHQS